MSRTLRAVLLQLALLCLLFDAAYLAYAVRTPQAAPTPAPVVLDADGPRLVALEDSYDFGTIEQASEVSHVFIVKNDGRQPLEISDVSTTCGCTATVLDRKTIPAGEEARIEATFSSGTGKGHFKKSITIYSNDPFSPKRLDITGTIQPLLTIDPEVIVMDDLTPGFPETVTVTVSPTRSDLPLQLHNPRTAAAGVSMSEPVRFSDPPGSYRFEVTLDPSRFGGSASLGNIIADTGLDAMPRVNIRVMAQVGPSP